MERYLMFLFLEDSTIKIGIIPKAVYRFNTCKKSNGFFRAEMSILKFMWNCKWLQIAKTVSIKKKVAEFILLRFKA